MTLIGLAGYGGVGKDTVADILVKNHLFTKFSFSDTLYREVSDAFSVSQEWLQDRAIKDSPQPEMALSNCKDTDFVEVAVGYLMSKSSGRPPRLGDHLTPRIILQLWGTEYRRAQDQQYWIRRAQEFVDEQLLTRKIVRLVNTSVRFENEVRWVHDLGGTVWKIERGLDRPNDHEAESGVSMRLVSRVLVNDGSIADLHKKIELIARAHGW